MSRQPPGGGGLKFFLAPPRGYGPAQLVGANFKKKIRPRQISKVTSLQCRINLVAKVAYAMGPELSRAPSSLGLYFFVLKIFSPQGRMQDLPNGGGGGGAAPSIGPRALETLATPLLRCHSLPTKQFSGIITSQK